MKCMHACMSGCMTGWLSGCQTARLVKKVVGAQVTDCKPKRPNWGMLSSGEVHSTTIAAWGHLVLLGDADGNLNKWDTTTSVHLLCARCLHDCSTKLSSLVLHMGGSCCTHAVLCCAVPCCATASSDVCARLCFTGLYHVDLQ